MSFFRSRGTVSASVEPSSDLESCSQRHKKEAMREQLTKINWKLLVEAVPSRRDHGKTYQFASDDASAFRRSTKKTTHNQGGWWFGCFKVQRFGAASSE